MKKKKITDCEHLLRDASIEDGTYFCNFCKTKIFDTSFILKKFEEAIDRIRSLEDELANPRNMFS